MGYVVFHLDKSAKNESAMTEHIERKNIAPNVDSTRVHLNKELIAFPDGVTNRTEAIQHRIKNAGLSRKVGKNQVQVIRVILSGSTEDMLKIQAEGKLDDWCRDSLDYLKKEFGEENIVAATLHLDEDAPHIHASIVPIVQGERRKKKSKKEQEVPKKQYKKKNANRPRLCADDLMTKDKLIYYQDSYADAMVKYGLERGIRGSQARHISTAEHYRNQKMKSDNLQIDIGLLIAQQEAKQKDIEQLERQEQQKETELKKTEEALTKARGELKTEKLKNTAADIGSSIVDGIGSLMGTSKVKRQQQEIEGLKAEIEVLQNENENTHKETQKVIREKDRLILEKDSIISSQKGRLDKLFDYLPILNEYDFIVRLCELVKIPTHMVKQIFAGKVVSYTGKLYSPEHKQNFDAQDTKISIAKNPKENNKLCLAIGGEHYMDWFRQKYKEFQQSIGIKINETKRQQGVKR